MESIARARAALVFTAVVMFHPWTVLAYSTGITGVSGKQGTSCSSCHLGGVSPAVHFEGPTEVAPGATATFRFVVQSQAPSEQIAAGLDIATSAGKLAAVSGQGEQLLSGEITHTGPKRNDASGMASWDFTWQAPAQVGSATLFGAGNSVNLSGNSFGDLSATTTYQVAVADVAIATPTDPPEVPTETPTPTATLEPPTPSATPDPPISGCVGDCDGSGDVTINEIVSGVNIALDNGDLAACPSLDANQDGQVTVNELLQAVNAAVNGCPPATGQ